MIYLGVIAQITNPNKIISLISIVQVTMICTATSSPAALNTNSPSTLEIPSIQSQNCPGLAGNGVSVGAGLANGLANTQSHCSAHGGL